MVIENQIPKTETVYELKEKCEIPSFEEFMKNYENDGNLNYDDLSGGDIGEDCVSLYLTCPVPKGVKFSWGECNDKAEAWLRNGWTHEFELNGNVGFSDGSYNFVFCTNEYPFKNYRVGEEIEVNITNAKHMSSQNYHQVKLELDSFYNVLEPLEEFIDKAGYYPNFRSRRQLYRRVIQDSEGTLENNKNLFLTDLYIFSGAVEGEAEFIMETNNVLEGNDEKIVRETDERDKVRAKKPDLTK
ncbi:158_t:CDS:2, partial [Ambispora gerdemannii]